MVEAAYTPTKHELLRRANLRLAVVRHLWRMAHELKTISTPRYAHGAKLLEDLGVHGRHLHFRAPGIGHALPRLRAPLGEAAMKQHEAMGFASGWGQVADQHAEVAESMARGA